MSETLLQDIPSMAETFFSSSKLIGNLGHICAADILQFAAFEQIPDPLLRIEFGRIAWEAFQMEPFGRTSREKVLDRLRPVDRCAIPDHQELAGNLAQQEAQEAHDGLRIIGMVLRLHEESPIRGDPANRREMIPGQLHPQHGRLPTWRVGAHCHGQQVKTGLIYEDDRSFFLFGLFLSAGQRSAFQLRIASSLRWVARCTGFWTLCLRARRMRLQWAG